MEPNSLTAELKTQLEVRTRELAETRKALAEALEQQTATSEVLRVISRSPAELEPVFQAMLANAVRICEAKFGTLYLREADAYRPVALHNAPPAYAAARTRDRLVRPPPDVPLGRVAITKQVAHIADIRATNSYIEGNPFVVAAADLAGYRAVLAVPMINDDELVGAIVIHRAEVRPFTDKQIELVQNFAHQAVVAIENARLVNELRQRTDDLTESLEQQTATSEVLRAISTSPGNLQPVFETILANATWLCEAKFGVLFRSDGDALRAVALHGAPPLFAEERRRNPVIRPSPDSTLGRAIAAKRTVQIADVQDEPTHVDSPSGTTGAQLAKLAGARALVAVPMLKQNELIGAIVIYRQEVAPFTDRQIELVTTFADQAVIAIENVRLFDEIQDKNRQLQLASENKSQFLSSMSHELRTPLNAIIGLTEMMVTNAPRFGTEKALEPLRRVNAAGTHLLSLINEVLDLSKIEAGKLELNPEPINLAWLIDEVIGTAGQLAEKNRNRLIVEAQDNVGALNADTMRLKQILLNLLSNACKFTKEGEVVLRVRKVADGRDWVGACRRG
jgi:GAF domain-containing protein